MQTSLDLEEHLGAIETVGVTFVDDVVRAGFDRPVPTCPGWTVRDLVAHQSMVHRWAAAQVRDDSAVVVRQEEIVATVVDLIGYYRDGLAALLNALREAPDDLDALVFLRDAPPPRRFWARRQAHELAIHRTDAVAARLGRSPTAAEVGISPDFAVDGIDELVCGFLPRAKSSGLTADEPYTITVRPSDRDRGWSLRVADGRVVTRQRATDDADVTFTGTAAQLYLGLWNRGDEITASGRPDVLARWRRAQRVTWS